MSPYLLAPLDLERDGGDWPNRRFSHRVRSGALLWHVQLAGEGPPLLLVHGTAASTHSWRDVLPILARRHRVLAIDLPGHAFTSPFPHQSEQSLDGMARALKGLLDEVGFEPQIAVGHSAGAALLVRMCLSAGLAPRQLVALNGALLPFPGLGRHFFPLIARAAVRSPLAARLLSDGATPETVARLIKGMGSTLDRRGIALYHRLLRNRHHVAAALAMMAHWNLEGLQRDLAHLSAPLALIVGGRDMAVSPETAEAVRQRSPASRVHYLQGLGHLAHEEQPETVVDLIERIAPAPVPLASR